MHDLMFSSRTPEPLWLPPLSLRAVPCRGGKIGHDMLGLIPLCLGLTTGLREKETETKLGIEIEIAIDFDFDIDIDIDIDTDIEKVVEMDVEVVERRRWRWTQR